MAHREKEQARREGKNGKGSWRNANTFAGWIGERERRRSGWVERRKKKESCQKGRLGVGYGGSGAAEQRKQRNKGECEDPVTRRGLDSKGDGWKNGLPVSAQEGKSLVEDGEPGLGSGRENRRRERTWRGGKP